MARKLTPTDCLKTPMLPCAYVNFTGSQPGSGELDVDGWSEMEWQIFSVLYRQAMGEIPADSLPE